jgi:beta-galactosidase/beta-glucuronidase
MHLKGTNMHEHDPVTGHTIDEALMLKDIRLMKMHNINAVRTSHYPQPERFYELCDEYGIYLIDEANIESHGIGYHPDITLATGLSGSGSICFVPCRWWSVTRIILQ